MWCACCESVSVCVFSLQNSAVEGLTIHYTTSWIKGFPQQKSSPQLALKVWCNVQVKERIVCFAHALCETYNSLLYLNRDAACRPAGCVWCRVLNCRSIFVFKLKSRKWSVLLKKLSQQAGLSKGSKILFSTDCLCKKVQRNIWTENMMKKRMVGKNAFLWLKRFLRVRLEYLCNVCLRKNWRFICSDLPFQQR